jgi:endonuclease/exonuclease/phosphatase family metal-dependent hydrolase
MDIPSLGRSFAMSPLRNPPRAAARALVGPRRSLRVATYNIHKGMSQFNRRVMVYELRSRLRAMGADVIFLQEVVGAHERHARRFIDWPEEPQYKFLAESVWPDYAYGKNAVHDAGHHGNAVLSRYPILRWENQDVSAHPLESRGLLHCEIAVPGWQEPVHCVCVHLGLTARWRRQQIAAIEQRIHEMVPDTAPLVIAGDFNDWHGEAGAVLIQGLNLVEVFESMTGRAARSYPAAMPVLRLDRIYVRGLRVADAHVHRGRSWSRISDHAALSATMFLG